MRHPLIASTILAALTCFPAVILGGVKDGDRPAALLVAVRLDSAVKLTHLRPGDGLRGKVKGDVYSGVQQLIPSGSTIDMTVSKTERRRRTQSDRWPWVVKFFSPRHANYPSSLAAVVHLPDGSEMPIGASLVAASHEVKLTAQEAGKKARTAGKSPNANSSPKSKSDSDATPTLVLEFERPLEAATTSPNSGNGLESGAESLAAGTVAHVILLDSLRASKSHTGDAFLARLSVPLRVDSKLVLPEGALIQGTVVRSVPPRWLSRPGSLALTFSQVRLPGVEAEAFIASPTSAVVNRASGMRMNSEGTLSGGSPSKVRILIDLGVTGGISKVTDDSFQAIAEALVSTATDASTAGSARIVAAALSAVYMLTRHGKDVFLPPYTRMDISLDRPASLRSRVSP